MFKYEDGRPQQGVQFISKKENLPKPERDKTSTLQMTLKKQLRTTKKIEDDVSV